VQRIILVDWLCDVVNFIRVSTTIIIYIFFITTLIMDTHNFKILKYSLDQDEIGGLCNFDYEENCPSCCDIYKSYLELYKQMVSNKVST